MLYEVGRRVRVNVRPVIAAPPGTKKPRAKKGAPGALDEPAAPVTPAPRESGLGTIVALVDRPTDEQLAEHSCHHQTSVRFRIELDAGRTEHFHECGFSLAAPGQ